MKRTAKYTISQLSRLALVVGLTVPTVAWGQASPQAEALFRDGKRLMKDGKLSEACAAFEGSERAEPNLATLLSLADCREKTHQYASAWALFLQADSQTRSDPSKARLNKTAKTRALGLEPRLSHLTIQVPVASRLPELVVTRDDVPIDPAEWNRPIPIDGGAHVVAGQAPGHEPWSTRVTLEPEAAHQSVEVPTLKPLHETVKPPDQLTLAALAAEPPVAPRPGPSSASRKLALGMTAGGVVAGGIAIYFGLDASGLHDDAVARCPASACSPQAAIDAQDKNDLARSHATIANIGFGVAGAALLVGGILWVVGAPESANVTVAPQVGETSGLSIAGRF